MDEIDYEAAATRVRKTWRYYAYYWAIEACSAEGIAYNTGLSTSFVKDVCAVAGLPLKD